MHQESTLHVIFYQANSYGQDLTYRMHNLYHDLALSIVGANCRLDYLDEKTRHVSFSNASSFTRTRGGAKNFCFVWGGRFVLLIY